MRHPVAEYCSKKICPNGTRWWMGEIHSINFLTGNNNLTNSFLHGYVMFMPYICCFWSTWYSTIKYGRTQYSKIFNIQNNILSLRKYIRYNTMADYSTMLIYCTFICSFSCTYPYQVSFPRYLFGIWKGSLVSLSASFCFLQVYPSGTTKHDWNQYWTNKKVFFN